MQYRMMLALLAVTAARGAVGNLVLNPSEAASVQVCLAGIHGATADEQCKTLLDFVQEGKAKGKKDAACEEKKKLKKHTKAFLISKRSSRTSVMEDESKGSDSECKSSCSESSSCSSMDESGFFKKVKCCKTVRERLAKYEATKARCEMDDKTVPCWGDLQKTLPVYINHYEKLNEECEAKCAGKEEKKEKKEEKEGKKEKAEKSAAVAPLPAATVVAAGAALVASVGRACAQ